MKTLEDRALDRSSTPIHYKWRESIFYVFNIRTNIFKCVKTVDYILLLVKRGTNFQGVKYGVHDVASEKFKVQLSKFPLTSFNLTSSTNHTPYEYV